MPTSEFLDRVVSRIDKLDRKSLQNYIVELLRQTKFLARLLDELPHALMVIDSKKGIAYANRRMVRLFDISEPALRKGSLEQAIPDQPLARLISESLDHKKEIFDQEFETILPRPMILRSNLFFLENPEEPAAAVLSLANVTQSEMNIRERFKLENWESMLGLAAGIAHEIGNPLNSLAIHLKLLSRTSEKLPHRERKQVETSLRVMEDETRRLDQIVRNFLKATRRKPLRFELGQVNELISKTLALMKPELRESKIRVEGDLDNKMPPFLFDPERMQQVFVNVIKNAIHAMPKGGILEIQSESRGKLCLIRFRDSGVGIPEESIHKIFDAYYTTREEGSGLGLMIVHQIIREHSGRMEVSSKPNFGTTFTVILPVRTEKLGLPELPLRRTR